MDYLNALPVEIWRDIFLQVASFSTIPIDASKPPSFIKPNEPEYKNLQKVQTVRLRLLTLCKSLSPLIEPLLYTEVTLRGQKRIDMFIKTTLIQQERDPGRSEWTKSISIFGYLEDDQAEYRPPSNNHSLFAICPALVHLFLDEILWNRLPPTLTITGVELNALRTITIKAFQPRDILRALPSFAPRLKHLNLESTTSSFRQLDDIVNFPSVRSARICRPMIDHGRPELYFPSLHQVSLALNFMFGGIKFFQRHALTLVELELAPYHSRVRQTHLVLPDDLFTLCRQLKKLTFDGTNIKTPEENMNMTHHNFQVLVLSMETPTMESNMEDKAKYFSRDSFPNLSSITCHFRGFRDILDIANFGRAVSHLFPVELNLDFEDKTLELI